MDSKRSLVVIGATVLVALGAGQYLQMGTAQSAVAATSLPKPEQVQATLRRAAGTPLAGYAETIMPAALTAEAEPLAPLPAPSIQASPEPDCPIGLEAFAADGAILSITLTAPCRPNQGVVLRHSSLSVTYQTTATGSLFVDLPALDQKGDVSIRFSDGTEVSTAVPVPDLAGLRRFALQWIEGDDFTLVTKAPVVSLGSAATVLPMYAVVTTLPAADTPLSIETPITATACGREALGAAFFAEGGKLRIADLSVALPDCDAEGGFVVLNNPVADMKLASTE